MMAVSSNQIATAARRTPASIRRIEQRAANAAGQPLAQALATAQRAAVREWLSATERQTAPDPRTLERLIAAIKKALAGAFRGAGTAARDTIRQAALQAAHLSAQQASALAAAMRAEPTPAYSPPSAPTPLPRPTPSRQLSMKTTGTPWRSSRRPASPHSGWPGSPACSTGQGGP